MSTCCEVNNFLFLGSTVDITEVLEENPKWHVLYQILKEIEVEDVDMRSLLLLLFSINIS